MSKGQPNKRYTPKFKIMAVEAMRKKKLSYFETARIFEIPKEPLINTFQPFFVTLSVTDFRVFLKTAKRTLRFNHRIPNGDKTIAKWERIYLEEGEDGLRIERRGRSCSAGGKVKNIPPKLNKKVEEDLIGEVQRLRAENAYLKKLNALVAERVRQEKNHK